MKYISCKTDMIYWTCPECNKEYWLCPKCGRMDKPSECYTRREKK